MVSQRECEAASRALCPSPQPGRNILSMQWSRIRQLWTWHSVCLVGCVIVVLLHQFDLIVLFLLLAIAVPVAPWQWQPRVAGVPAKVVSRVASR